MKSLTEQLIRAVANSNSLQSNYLSGCYEQLTSAEKNWLESYLFFLKKSGLTLSYLTECYNMIVEDTKREQLHFMRFKRYRYASFTEVKDSVYFNEAYMEKYMFGLAITSFLWPNHVAMNRFFVQHLPTTIEGNYLEVGPGHGLHLATALNTCRFNAYYAVDISPKSAALTKSLIRSSLVKNDLSCEILITDFLLSDLPGKPYQALVMGEVIEHVEAPEAFLRRIHAVTTPDAFVYVTTAINAAAIDHIYLLRSGDDFDKLIETTGFRCQHRLLLPYKGKTIAECERDSLPMNVAAVLEKR